LLEQINSPYKRQIFISALQKKIDDGHIPTGKYLSGTVVNITGLVEQAVSRTTTTGQGRTESSRVGSGEATWEMVEQINEGLSKIPH
jgi:hypothetical protein